MPHKKISTDISHEGYADKPQATAARTRAILRNFSRGVQLMTDFLVADACYFCGRVRTERGSCLATDTSTLAAAALCRASVVYLFGLFPLENHPICARCARCFEVASEPGLVGRHDGTGRVVTRAGDVFDCAGERPAGVEVIPAVTGGAWRSLTVTAPFRMNDMSLKLIHLIKFSGRRSLIQPVARAVVCALENQTGANWRRKVLVPVPMDRASRSRRGFNQAETLAFALSGLAAVKVAPGALKKVRKTPPQSLTEKRNRTANVRGAFRAAGNSVKGREVLLVDDLVTTGATAAACTSALIAAGARAVTVTCLASAL